MSRAISGGKQYLQCILLAAAAMMLSSAAVAQSKGARYDATGTLSKAGRQPMLVERMTKSYTLIGQTVLVSRARRQMEESTKEFEVALRDLQQVAPTAEIKENYQLLEQLFSEYKEAVTTKPVTLENAKLLAEQNEELVWIATKGATLIQEYTKNTNGDLIVTVTDLGRLTQRIAKLYLFRSWGVRSDVIAKDLKEAETNYRNGIERLLRATQNSSAIKEELALAETQWIFLKQAIDRLNANQTSLTELENVTKSCDNILEVMERVTKYYKELKK